MPKIVSYLPAEFLNFLHGGALLAGGFQFHRQPTARDGDHHDQEQERAERELKPAAKH